MRPLTRAGKPDKPAAEAAERVVSTAGGFTGLWALTWLGAEALAVNTAVTGGFAAGSVVAGSGLTLLWWRTRTMRALRPEDEVAEAQAAEGEAQGQAQAP